MVLREDIEQEIALLRLQKSGKRLARAWLWLQALDRLDRRIRLQGRRGPKVRESTLLVPLDEVEAVEQGRSMRHRWEGLRFAAEHE